MPKAKAVALSKLDKVLPYIMIIGGLLGFMASFALTYDKIQVLKNPSYVPNCNINPVLSCGSVMKTEQASLFGVPNTIFGLVAFTALITVGFILLTGSVIKRWLWVAAQVAALLGVVFMHYLFFQGVFRIHAICPWCFLTWMITIPIFWYVTLYNLRHNYLGLPAKYDTISKFLNRYHIDILIVWYAAIFAILLGKFWYYWSTLI